MAKQVKRNRKVNRRGLSQQMKWMIAACVVAVVLLIAGTVYYLWNNSFVDMDLAQRTSLSVAGYNGRGTAEVSVEAVTGYLDFFETVETTLSKQEDLKNGDAVTVSYTYDEALAKEMGLRVNAEETTVVIEDLVEPVRVSFEELFDLVMIVYSDLSPMITAQVEVKETGSFLDNVTFTVIDPKLHYKDGDKLVIEADFDEELAFENAYVIEPGENGYRKEYEVISDDVYVSDADDITQEMIQQMYKNGAKYFDEAHAKEYGLRIFSEARLKPMWQNKKTFFSWVNPRLISAYFNAVTDEGRAFLENHANDVKIVYEATLTQPDGLACKAEVVVQYTDIIKRYDGTIDLRLDSGKIIAASYKNKNIKSIVSDTGDGHYISTKLKVE